MFPIYFCKGASASCRLSLDSFDIKSNKPEEVEKHINTDLGHETSAAQMFSSVGITRSLPLCVCSVVKEYLSAHSHFLIYTSTNT